MQDADLAPVHSVLDGQGRPVLTERSLPDGTHEIVQASYDAAGRLTTMTLSGGTVTRTFNYDTLGRLVQSHDPDLGTRTLTWDDGSRLLSETNAVGQTVQYTYDTVGRLSMRDTGSAYRYHYDDARPGAGLTASNQLGRLAWIEEPTGGTDVGYDELGHTTFSRRRIDDQVSEATTRYAASGLVLGRSYDDGFSLSYEYDPAGRLIGAGDLWSLLDQDASGLPMHERAQNGVETRFARDILGLASRVTVRDTDGSAIYDVSATRNSATEIAAEIDHDHIGLDHSATFGYDGFARLTNASVGTGASAFTFNYGYDVLHNMTSRTASHPLRAMFGTYRYGEGGHAPRQLTSIADASGHVTHTFDYDAAGRQIAEDDRTIAFDAADRVTSVTGLHAGSGAVTHAYGQDGARVKTAGPDGTVSYFFGDGTAQRNGVREHDVTAGERVVARITMARETAGPGAIARMFGIAVTFGPWGFACIALALALFAFRHTRRRRAVAAAMIGLTFAASCASPGVGTSRQTIETATRSTFMHVGFSAGPVVFTDATGHLLEERRYEAFGTPIDAHVHTAMGDVIGDPDLVVRDLNPLNKRTDASTGWSDHGARWMAPETGRWLTPDPPVAGPDAKFMSEPWALHPYQYVNQNPVAYWDPDGCSPLVPAIVGVIVGGAEGGALFTAGVVLAPVTVFGVAVGLAINYAPAAPVLNCGDYNSACWNNYIERLHAYQVSQEAAASDRLALIRERAQTASRAEAEPKSGERTVLLHRGVPEGHPGYEAATLGNAYPRGGNATALEHNMGDTQSQFTSWTRTWSVAESAALNSYFGETGRGVVLTARIPLSRIVKSEDVHEEDEVLVRGPVIGASVRYVPNGPEQRLESDE
jgi:RHS repeat-associated protein